ncbi:hypothetical protein [Kitasatospora sp. NPDC057223]
MVELAALVERGEFLCRSAGKPELDVWTGEDLFGDPFGVGRGCR